MERPTRQFGRDKSVSVFIHLFNHLIIYKNSLYLSIFFFNRDIHGNHRSIRHGRRGRQSDPIYDPMFHRYMLHRIKHVWIPNVENREVANGRKAYWDQTKSVIMFEENEVSDSE